MRDSAKLQAEARRSRDEFMQTAAQLRASLAPARLAKDLAAHFRSHPASLRRLIRSNSGQAIMSAMAILALGRMLKPVFGRRLSRQRS